MLPILVSEGNIRQILQFNVGNMQMRGDGRICAVQMLLSNCKIEILADFLN